MYVPNDKSIDDVTFLLSLRHHFRPQLKKIKDMEQNHSGGIVYELI